MTFNEPIRKGDGFRDDFINLLLLRPVWREAKEEQEEVSK